MNLRAFEQQMGRRPRRVPYASYVPATPPPMPAEAMMHFWHPDREGVEPAPGHVREELARIHTDLALCRPPANAPVASRAWAVWYRKPEITYWLSPGWMLFFVWQSRDDVDGKTVLTPLPLDSRLYANIYRFSALGQSEFSNAKGYFESVVQGMQREKAAQAKADEQYRHDHAHDFWQSTKIKNIGHGSKFAAHHDGSVVPSRGDIARMLDRGDRDMPGSVQRAERERKPKRTRT